MMIWAKIAFCLVLAAVAHGGVFWAARRSDEIRLLRRFVILTVLLKLAAPIGVYSVRPELGATSDAGLFYIHEARHVLAGELPYRDFESSYSPLFPVILAPAIGAWNSIGAIVLVMTAFETLMLAIYLRTSPYAATAVAYRTGFYYGLSPISVYWCALTGYNGSIIAMFAMLSLVLAARRRDIGAATAAVVGFLSSKLLMALDFPAVICYERRGSIIRGALVIGLLTAALGGPYLAGFNTLLPIKREMGNITNGNLWFLLSPFVAEETRRSPWWNVAPLFAFGAAFTVMFIPYARSMLRTRDGSPRFDAAAAFLAATNLLFMILSKKAWGFYLLMMLPFVVHAIVISSRDLKVLNRRLLPLSFLGAVTTTQDRLWMIVRDRPLNEPTTELATLWLLDFVIVACYAYLSAVCFRAALGEGPQADRAESLRLAAGR
jgi:hypothetical protein